MQDYLQMMLVIPSVVIIGLPFVLMLCGKHRRMLFNIRKKKKEEEEEEWEEEEEEVKPAPKPAPKPAAAPQKAQAKKSSSNTSSQLSTTKSKSSQTAIPPKKPAAAAAPAKPKPKPKAKPKEKKEKEKEKDAAPDLPPEPAGGTNTGAGGEGAYDDVDPRGDNYENLSKYQAVPGVAPPPPPDLGGAQSVLVIEKDPAAAAKAAAAAKVAAAGAAPASSSGAAPEGAEAEKNGAMSAMTAPQVQIGKAAAAAAAPAQSVMTAVKRVDVDPSKLPKDTGEQSLLISAPPPAAADAKDDPVSHIPPPIVLPQRIAVDMENAPKMLEANPHVLIWEFLEGQQCVKLTNNAAKRIILKTKMSDPKIFRVNPVYFGIDKGKTAWLTFIRVKSPWKYDKCVVEYAEDNATERNVQAAFKKINRALVKELVIPMKRKNE